jgi:hypothetical protein
MNTAVPMNDSSAAGSKTSRSKSNREPRQLTAKRDEILLPGNWPRAAADGACARPPAHSRAPVHNFAKRLQCVLAVCKDLAVACLPFVLITASLLLLCPASAHAQGGVPLWTNRYEGPSTASTTAAAIAVDNRGNVFVTGSAIIKYSGAGTPLWTNLSNLSHVLGSIAVDKNGNAFATDYWWNGSNNYALLAYSSAGVPLWTNRAAPNRSSSVFSIGSLICSGLCF